MIRTAALLTFVAVPVSLAQVAITFDIENPTLLPGESTVVRMFAGFDSTRDYAMGALDTDLLISTGSEGWSDAILLEPMDGPGTVVGVPSATGYDGIISGQIHFLGVGIFADPTNPIPFWQATYTAPTDAPAPFDIDLSTLTRRYAVYIDRERGVSESRMDELAEGSGTIRVIPVPVPASALVLGLGVVALGRRR